MKKKKTRKREEEGGGRGERERERERDRESNEGKKESAICMGGKSRENTGKKPDTRRLLSRIFLFLSLSFNLQRKMLT